MKKFFIFTGALALLGVGTYLYSDDKKSAKDLYEKLDIFTDALTIVEKSYVEEVDHGKLINGALDGMLRALDSHSQFLEPDDYNDMLVETEGEFGGLGIEITVKDKHLTVVTPLDGTPASKSGIQPGDRILKIDGVSTEDITLNKAIAKLRGRPGTKITLSITHHAKGKKELIDVVMTREVIKIDSIKDAKVLAGDVGYVRITQFQDNTTEDMDKVLRDLSAKGMKSLVLDLRNNPGGLLQEGIDTADRFLGDGKMIVYTKGRMPEQTMDFKGRTGPALYKMPMVVLVNDGSASAAEIVAGALQDWKRAVLLGSKTFGKGSVQSILPLKDGAALKLTTAKYYTPKGRSIHGKGIEPDIHVDVAEQDEIRLMLSKVDKLDETGATLVKPEDVHDLQLDRAVDLLKGIDIVMGAKADIKAGNAQDK